MPLRVGFPLTDLCLQRTENTRKACSWDCSITLNLVVRISSERSFSSVGWFHRSFILAVICYQQNCEPGGLDLDRHASDGPSLHGPACGSGQGAAAAGQARGAQHGAADNGGGVTSAEREVPLLGQHSPVFPPQSRTCAPPAGGCLCPPHPGLVSAISRAGW